MNEPHEILATKTGFKILVSRIWTKFKKKNWAFLSHKNFTWYTENKKLYPTKFVSQGVEKENILHLQLCQVRFGNIFIFYEIQPWSQNFKSAAKMWLRSTWTRCFASTSVPGFSALWLFWCECPNYWNSLYRVTITLNLWISKIKTYIGLHFNFKEKQNKTKTKNKTNRKQQNCQMPKYDYIFLIVWFWV